MAVGRSKPSVPQRLLQLLLLTIAGAHLAAAASRSLNSNEHEDAVGQLTLDQHTDVSFVSRPLIRGSGWQSWKPQWSGVLKRIDIFAGSTTPCYEMEGMLTVVQGIPGGKGAQPSFKVLSRQQVRTGCTKCQIIEATCLFAPACADHTCLSWQQWELADDLAVSQNVTYSFKLDNFSKGKQSVHVGVTLPNRNVGGLSSIIPNKHLGIMYSEMVFRTFMQQPSSQTSVAFGEVTIEKKEKIQNTNLSSSTMAYLIGGIVALLVLIALMLLLASKHRRKWLAEKLHTPQGSIVADFDSQDNTGIKAPRNAWRNTSVWDGLHMPSSPRMHTVESCEDIAEDELDEIRAYQIETHTPRSRRRVMPHDNGSTSKQSLYPPSSITTNPRQRQPAYQAWEPPVKSYSSIWTQPHVQTPQSAISTGTPSSITSIEEGGVSPRKRSLIGRVVDYFTTPDHDGTQGRPAAPQRITVQTRDNNNSHDESDESDESEIMFNNSPRVGKAQATPYSRLVVQPQRASTAWSIDSQGSRTDLSSIHSDMLMSEDTQSLDSFRQGLYELDGESNDVEFLPSEGQWEQ